MIAERSLTTSRASLSAARMAYLGVALFVALLLILHLVSAEIDPSWHVISDYQLGEAGWLMSLAFAALALGTGALAAAIRRDATGLSGRIGVVALGVAALGMALAAIFTTDPINAEQDAVTTSGIIHTVGAGLGIGVPIAAILLARSLGRHPAWSGSRSLLRLTAALTWAGFVVFSAAVPLMLGESGHFGPDVAIGWPNRFLMLTYCLWLFVVALLARRAGADRG